MSIKKEVALENLYIIGYGLGGGFGGMQNFEVVEADSLQYASEWAWESACQEYDRYAGMHGLRDVGNIIDEDGVDEEEAEEIFEEERESWLSYEARPYSKEYEKKVENHHYHNPYKTITDSI